MEIILEDLGFFLTASGIAYAIFMTAFNRKPLKKLFDGLSDFREFGYPPNVELFAKRTDMIMKFCVIIFNVCAIFYYIYGLLRTKSCEAINLKYGMKTICGCMTYIWLFFDLNYTPVREIVGIFVLINALIVVNAAGADMGIICTAIFNIITRAQHLKAMIRDAFSCESDKECRRRLIICYRYHQNLLR